MTKKTAIITAHTIQFQLGALEAIERNGELFVSVRRLCEAFGLAYGTQQQKLERDSRFTCIHMNTHDSAGRIQQMLAIPLEQVAGFLYSVNVNRVRAEIREKLHRYQSECTRVLHDYWTTGKAERRDAGFHMQSAVADVLDTLKDEYTGIYGKKEGVVPHFGLYARVQQAMNQAAFGLKKLPDGVKRTALPKAAIDRIRQVARDMNKYFIRGCTVAEACKKLADTYRQPVVQLSENRQEWLTV